MNEQRGRKKKGIANLPATLKEAIECLKSDPVICEALGEHALLHFIEAQEIGVGYVPHTRFTLGSASST